MVGTSIADSLANWSSLHDHAFFRTSRSLYTCFGLSLQIELKHGFCSGLLLWPIMVLAGVVITVLVVKFLNLVWFMTRGGHVHKQSKQHFLFGTPWTYAHFIKFATFLVAFVFANELFFATQYGVDSCWYRPNSSRFGSVDIPWWVSHNLNIFPLFQFEWLSSCIFRFYANLNDFPFFQFERLSSCIFRFYAKAWALQSFLNAQWSRQSEH